MVDEFIAFTVKARDTEDNRLTHEMFRSFAKAEADDNYTLALKLLIGKLSVVEEYKQLEERVATLEEWVVKSQENSDSSFF